MTSVQGAPMSLSPAMNPLSQDPETGWAEPEKPKADWIKRALLTGLAILSWVATYVGMLELIEANMGELPLVHRLIIGFSVAMLMTMVVWLLDELFKPNPWLTKILYLAGYLFLTIISIGFGFGFYWKVLESRSEASRSAESAVTEVQGALIAASTRLEQLTATLDQLTAVSTQKAQTEKAAGTSCPNSRPGEGPRRKMREDDAARFSFAADFVKGRAGAVRTALGALDGDLAKIITDDKSTVDAKTGTRNAFMQALGRKLDNTVTGFNAFRTDPQLKQIRTDLAERAEKTTFPDTQGKTFACPDPQLQTALRGVVRAIDQLPELEKPKIAAVEGSEATIEAFRRLTSTFYGALSFKLPPSADELRELQKKAIQSVENPGAAAAARKALNEQPGLSKRDYVPLAIAVFVDLCLLLVSMGKSHDRLSQLLPKMRAAERGPVIQILSRFNDIHRDQQIRENFELFRHVVFDFHGDYYVAVPMDAPRKLSPGERVKLREDTQLLSNLFASFEKEKIFSRVYSPFLTAGAVRKRLARQGSKFAHSDAFRLYRFKDGAWSDIILGAVMGAAKRVEAEKRREAARAEQTARATAALAASSVTAATGFGASQDESTVRGSGFADPRTEWPTTGPAEHADVRPGRPSAAEGPAFTRYRAPVRAPVDAQPAAPSPRRGPQHPFDIDPDHARRFGSYAAYVPAAMEDKRSSGASTRYGSNVHAMPTRANETDAAASDAATALAGPRFDAEAANSNTEPVTAPLPVADVLPFTPPAASRPAPASPRGSLAVAMPPAAAIEDADIEPAATPDWQNQLGVVMTRVTESITVPVSTAARLPEALARAGFVSEPARPVPPPSAALRRDTLLLAPVEDETWGPADTALVKKYAVQAGE